jgi:uncharacterized protein YdhG (YjbR/CyaY superfamily)
VVSSKAATVPDYLAALPDDRRAEIERVRDVVNAALPEGYVEGIGYGMIVWFIPLERYPDTYNKQPLGYAALAAQKNYNSLYLSIYYSRERTKKFQAAFADAGKELDMGKSCIRFKRADELALDVIAAEIASFTPDEFILAHEQARLSDAC